MCWCVVKTKGKDIPTKYLDKAQQFNSDGYSVSWHEDSNINTYRTFNWDRFKGILSTLTDVEAIVHLRNATVGSVTYSNIHPFELDNGGVMFHNGTISSLKGKEGSDSKALATMINSCTYEELNDVMPFIEHLVDDRINRLVFMESNGDITIVNQDLGIEEDNIWYSNDYHLKADTWSRGTTYTYYRQYSTPVIKQEPVNTVVETSFKLTQEEILDACMVDYSEDETYTTELYRVFVYGTLKRGYHNHRILTNSTFLGKATSTELWAMEGASMSYPYLLSLDEDGHCIEGELYLVSEAVLDKLNMLEGYPTHYKYDLIEVVDDDGEIVEALTYVKAGVSLAKKEDYIAEWRPAY